MEGKSPIDLDYLREFDITVFNYPEKPFTTKEIRKVFRYVRSGGMVFVSAYYNNEDGVAAVASRLTQPFGIKFNFDAVTGEKEGYLITATAPLDSDYESEREIKPTEFINVYFPCSCSITCEGNYIPTLIYRKKICALLVKEGKGCLVALGTSVFWDNFSIYEKDNLKFVNWLFQLQ